MAPIVAFIPLIAAGIGAATSAIALSHQPKAPAAPVNNQTDQARAQQEAAQAQAAALQKRRGLASTILTSPTGVSGATQTQHATLGT